MERDLKDTASILAAKHSVHLKGYALIWWPSHPNAWKTGWVRRSHAVLYSVGRPVSKGFIAHHRDENKLNDDPSNLEVLAHGEHSHRHAPEVHPKMRAAWQAKGWSYEERQQIAERMKGNRHGEGPRDPDFGHRVSLATRGKIKTCRMCGMPNRTSRTHANHLVKTFVDFPAEQVA